MTATAAGRIGMTETATGRGMTATALGRGMTATVTGRIGMTATATGKIHCLEMCKPAGGKGRGMHVGNDQRGSITAVHCSGYQSGYWREGQLSCYIAEEHSHRAR
jgi:hypothetical protein